MTRLVLVGGGHAHVQSLCSRELAARCELVLVVDRPLAVYSGMVPGFVAGDFRQDELEIDLRPLAERAGARLVLERAVRIDVDRRRIELSSGASVDYDLASFDVGSTVSGLELPGVRAHTAPTRPIGEFVSRVSDALDATSRSGAGPLRIVVVGGGAAGIELVFCLRAALSRGSGRAVSARLLEAGPQILPGASAALRRRVLRAAALRGIEIDCNRRVERAERGRLIRRDTKLDCDLVAWVTGASGVELFRASGLAVDARGFVRTRATFQLLDHDDLFAAGDCAALEAHPDLPKAGLSRARKVR